MAGNQKNKKNSIIGTVLGESKILLSAFLAGTGVILWIVSFIFNPTKLLEQRMALVEQSINVIQENHLVHLQQSLDKTDKRVEKLSDKVDDIYLIVIDMQSQINQLLRK